MTRRTSRTGVPYDALKLTEFCRTKNMSRISCEPGAGPVLCPLITGIDATRFIGNRIVGRSELEHASTIFSSNNDPGKLVKVVVGDSPTRFADDAKAFSRDMNPPPAAVLDPWCVKDSDSDDVPW
jgi:hypothetical protein